MLPYPQHCHMGMGGDQKSPPGTAMELGQPEEKTLESPATISGPAQAEQDSGGPFRLLPAEIVQHLFAFLPLPDLGNLALSSLWMRQAVQDWTGTCNCLNRIFRTSGLSDARLQQQVAETAHPQQQQQQQFLNSSRDLAFRLLRSSSLGHRGYAVLVKRLTCLQSTGDRVRVAFAAFDRVLSYQDDGAKVGGDSQDWLSTLYAVRFSLMAHVFSRGWDESEYPTLAAAIDQKFGLEQRLRSVMASSRGADVCVSSEMHLRLTLRALTWDFAGSDYGHRANWLLAMLKRLVGNCSQSQALVFFLLFGPACHDGQSHHDNPMSVWEGHRRVMVELNNHAEWEAFVDNTADDFHEGKDMFYTLAQAVCSCMTAVDWWRDRMLVQVLDHLFCVPSPWRRDNVAGFLLFCSEKLILEYLRRKLDKKSGFDRGNNVRLVARLLVDMIVVSYRFDNELSRERGIGKIFDAMCVYLQGESERHSLFDSIWRSLARELEERQLEAEEDDLMEVLQGFGTHVMRQAYLCGHRDRPDHPDQGRKTPDTLPLDQEDEEMMEE